MSSYQAAEETEASILQASYDDYLQLQRVTEEFLKRLCAEYRRQQGLQPGCKPDRPGERPAR
jgi:hypothetical protein